MKKELCELTPTQKHPMLEDRATELYGKAVYKQTRFWPRIDKELTSKERVEVERSREQMLRNIAATYPVPRGIFSRKCTPHAVG